MSEFVTILTIGMVAMSVGLWAAGRVFAALTLVMDALDRRWR